MGLTIRKVLLGGALLCAGAGAADATIVHETYTGTISFGMEPNGRFGAPTANLSGKTLTIAFRFDLGAGGSSTDDGSTSASYGGGPDEGRRRWQRSRSALVARRGISAAQPPQPI